MDPAPQPVVRSRATPIGLIVDRDNRDIATPPCEADCHQGGFGSIRPLPCTTRETEGEAG
jgi:hypothetical protein